jgi:hypothetical protein
MPAGRVVVRTGTRAAGRLRALAWPGHHGGRRWQLAGIDVAMLLRQHRDGYYRGSHRERCRRGAGHRVYPQGPADPGQPAAAAGQHRCQRHRQQRAAPACPSASAQSHPDRRALTIRRQLTGDEDLEVAG